jgi:ABC-type transporter Mla maintaining outer membrane lipid asymmetry ATPase subunit MlaF
MPDSSQLLTLEDVTAIYDGAEEPVLRNISLSVGRGEVAGLASLDNGGGKTSLARVAAGLLPPTSGRVLFDGEDVYAMGYQADQRFRAQFSLVLEGGALLVNRTVWDNVALPLRYHGELRGRELNLAVERLLAQCGYSERIHAFPWQITERSRRLAAFARALARDPKFVIVDRFFEGMEMPDWRRLFELVMELNQQQGVSWLLISELDPTIFQVAERVAILDRGRLLGYDFRRQLYKHPRIRAAFEASEMRTRQESLRVLRADSDPTADAFAPGASEGELGVATPRGGREDLGATIDLDGAMPRLAREAWLDAQERQARRSSTVEDPGQTIDLEGDRRGRVQEAIRMADAEAATASSGSSDVVVVVTGSEHDDPEDDAERTITLDKPSIPEPPETVEDPGASEPPSEPPPEA